MTAKEYLSQAPRISIRLKAMAEQLEHLKSVAEYLGVQYSDMPKSPRNLCKNEDAVIRVLEMEGRMNIEFAHLAEINDTIEEMTDPQQQAILVKRYISEKPWETIASELNISVRHVQRLHNDALDEVAQTLKVGMECH